MAVRVWLSVHMSVLLSKHLFSPFTASAFLPLPLVSAVVPLSFGLCIQCSLCMQERLGLILEKEDEMDCLVGGCNFLLKAIRHEAFTYANGSLNFVTNTGKHFLKRQVTCSV